MLENRYDIKKMERVDGYFLTLDQLEKLILDFSVECHHCSVSNHKTYIENWLKNNE